MSVQAIIGMGEVGSAIFELLDKQGISLIGEDIRPDKTRWSGLNEEAVKKGIWPGKADVIHICFPCHKDFVEKVLKWIEAYNPEEVVIHSTVAPGTTEQVQIAAMDKLIVYSPVRGVHSRMLMDLKRYTKYWACRKLRYPSLFVDTFTKSGVNMKRMSNAIVLELAKIYVDTAYYGWLILYAQHTKEVCDSFNVDWNEMWEFSDEIQQFLSNRPKMYPGEGIGGHCILPNLNLIYDEFLDLVFAHDKHYRRRFE